jgi:hypothetical protein
MREIRRQRHVISALSCTEIYGGISFFMFNKPHEDGEFAGAQTSLRGEESI